MTFTRSATMGVLASALLAVQAPVAVAQKPPDGLKNPLVEISYEPPRTAALAEFRTWLQNRYVLEKLQVFLSPLNLTERLVVKADECGVPHVLYTRGAPVVLCYEYVAKVDADAPRIGQVVQLGQTELTREEALVGPITQLVLHDVARAIFHMYKLPVWGGAEFAADNVAAYTMVNFSQKTAWKTVVGTAWFLKSGWDRPVDISDIRPHVAQRYFALLCVAYAADQVQFEGFLQQGPKPKVYEPPVERANTCLYDYEKLSTSFMKTIFEPHVDRPKFEQLRKLEWLKDF